MAKTAVVVMMFGKKCLGKKGAGLLARGWPRRSSDSHVFPQVLPVLWALYFAKKRVQYDSGRRAAKEPG
jgi:hypothetical protein